ncbi:MAG: sigma-70 family RNA polymerase sigma factor [bacterium]
MIDNSEYIDENEEYLEGQEWKEKKDKDILNSKKQFIEDVQSKRVLTKEEVDELLEKYMDSEEPLKSKYKNIIMEHHIRLIVFYVNKIHKSVRNVDYLDLVQEGMFGLIGAVETFEFEHDVKFTTYAIICIKNKIANFIIKYGNGIHIPSNIIYLQKKINSARQHYKLMYAVEPTIDELSSIIDESSEAIEKVLNNEIVSTFGKVINLGSGSEKVGSTEFHEQIASTDMLVEDTLLKSEFENNIMFLIDDAIEKEEDREMLKHYYGFYDNKTYSYQQIADIFNTTRSVVVKTINSSMYELRTYTNIHNFKTYLDKPDTDLILEIPENKVRKNNVMNATIYEIFNEFTKEQIDSVLSSLNNNEYEQMTARFGVDFNVRYDCSEDLDKEKIYTNNAFFRRKMKKYTKDVLSKTGVIIGNKANRTVYEEFSDFDKEAIDFCLLVAEKKYKNELYMRFGSNYDVVNNQEATREYKDNATIVIRMLKTLLTKYKYKNDKFFTLSKFKEIKKEYKTLIYDDYKQYSKNIIDSFLEEVDNELKDKLLKRYGADYSVLFEVDNKLFLEYKKNADELKVLLDQLLLEYSSKHVVSFKVDESIDFNNNFLDNFSDKEKEIISLLYNVSNNYSLEEISKLMNVDIEYVVLVAKKVSLLHEKNNNINIEENLNPKKTI